MRFPFLDSLEAEVWKVVLTKIVALAMLYLARAIHEKNNNIKASTVEEQKDFQGQFSEVYFSILNFSHEF